MYVCSWWQPTNSNSIYSHAPYLSQRLNRADFLKYIKKFHSEEQEEYKAAYDFFDSSHPTINDYLVEGLKNDLVPHFFLNVPQNGEVTKTRGITPVGFAENCPKIHFEILKNINKFNKNIRLEDLFSGQYYIIFKKRNTKSSMDSEKLKKEEQRLNFKYRPKSTIGKAIKNFAINVTAKKN